MAKVDPSQLIVTRMPLTNLWDEKGHLNAHRVKHVGWEEISQFLRDGATFVVAEVGHKSVSPRPSSAPAGAKLCTSVGRNKCARLAMLACPGALKAWTARTATYRSNGHDALGKPSNVCWWGYFRGTCTI